jgi:hypothetical protein
MKRAYSDDETDIGSSDEEDEAAELRAENEALRAENEALRAENEALRAERATRFVQDGARQPRALQVVNECSIEHPFSLGMLLPENWQTDPDDTDYKTAPNIHFPHRKVGGNFVVMARPYVEISVRLCNMVTQAPATEKDVSPGRPLRFKLDLLFADNLEVVSIADLTGRNLHLFDPPETQVGIKSMTNGRCDWRFRCLFTSRQTKQPSGRLFLLRVSCVNPELAHLKTLSYTTPFSFKVVSRRFKQKANVPCTAPSDTSTLTPSTPPFSPRPV